MTIRKRFSANFNLTRRHLLKGASACAALALAPHNTQAQPAPVPLDAYQCSFFNAEEWAFVMAAAERLIPAQGNGPGALETRVPVYIDKQLATPWGQGEHWYRQAPFNRDAPRYTGYQAAPSPAEAYRIAIPRINQWCQDRYGAIFADLAPEQQDDALAQIEKDNVPIDEIRSGDFFSFLLANTKEGYFSDPLHGGNYKMASWVYIGFPGARASFLEWVDRDNVRYPLGPVSFLGERA
ncbi:MAG: Gluconate 2-dehydrogenase subunit 3 protein [Candidatus Tokpelaia hoelldobleri]|uniref:Gluconate 2-dehydrogenase subunit 3 protein n=1 Tax=Candidatus Tokpelaia hoelldobleri TaxID=1902579 RepID=A0A1U9JX08_9HYPH|nr:MAG: Gluconate 2-dehydrogenase subunit 3 protein [Candidatus Tokpelaia hoelldoblerii]